MFLMCTYTLTDGKSKDHINMTNEYPELCLLTGFHKSELE